MASKTISVTEDVYRLLKRVKLPNESFGDTIQRFIQNYSMKNIIEWYTTSQFEPISEAEASHLEKAVSRFSKGFQPQNEELQ